MPHKHAQALSHIREGEETPVMVAMNRTVNSKDEQDFMTQEFDRGKSQTEEF